MSRTRPVATTLLVLIFSLCCSCSSREIKLSSLPVDAVILAFGDSITFGTGALPGQSYPEILQRSIHRKVVNAGVPGETSAQGLARLPHVLAESRPKLVILCHGGNDILRKLDPGITKANLVEMVKLARKQGAEVVLIAVPRVRLVLAPAPMYKQISEDMRVPLENDIVLSILTNRDLKSDYIHPNSEGYARLAAATEALLKKFGALP